MPPAPPPPPERSVVPPPPPPPATTSTLREVTPAGTVHVVKPTAANVTLIIVLEDALDGDGGVAETVGDEDGDDEPASDELGTGVGVEDAEDGVGVGEEDVAGEGVGVGEEDAEGDGVGVGEEDADGEGVELAHAS